MAVHWPPGLPTVDGVGPSCVALPPGPWPTVLAYLTQRFPAIDPGIWVERMASGRVLDERALPLPPDAPYRGGSRAWYYRALPTEDRVPFDEALLYQDAHILVVDKPHFLPVTPGGRFVQETLLVRLKRRLGLEGLQPVHRIDRETAGLVLLCLEPNSRDAYHRMFREQAVHKVYEAVAPWREDLALPLQHSSRIVQGQPFMRMREAAGEPNAHTRIELICRLGEAAHYRLQPGTGRKHQLRVHMAALGLPILNDSIYPVLQPAGPPDYARPLQLLARSLAFTDPVTGQARAFTSRLQLSAAGTGTP